MLTRKVIRMIDVVKLKPIPTARPRFLIFSLLWINVISGFKRYAINSAIKKGVNTLFRTYIRYADVMSRSVFLIGFSCIMYRCI